MSSLIVEERGKQEMSTLFLGKKNVASLLNMATTIKAVEQAFLDYAMGRAAMPPKAYVAVERGDFRAMPAALPGAVGLKWVNVHPGNYSFGLPTVMAVIIYNDPLTGYPLAVMDATDITAYRTGAAAAIASKYLARKDSNTLGIIGAGRQAQTQLLAHTELFDFTEIRIYDQFPLAAEKFMQMFANFPIKVCSIEETVACDIVCTLTPTRKWYLKREWVRPGTHINAVGADAEGKEELDPAIIREAKVIVDDVRQSSKAGEINVPVSEGLFSVQDIYATLGDVIAGKKPGRQNDRDITVFDSTGIAIEDIAVAKIIYDEAHEKEGIMSVDFMED